MLIFQMRTDTMPLQSSWQAHPARRRQFRFDIPQCGVLIKRPTGCAPGNRKPARAFFNAPIAGLATIELTLWTGRKKTRVATGEHKFPGNAGERPGGSLSNYLTITFRPLLPRTRRNDLQGLSPLGKTLQRAEGFCGSCAQSRAKEKFSLAVSLIQANASLWNSES